MRFKNIEGKLERESSKKTISTSGGLLLLQMLSEPNIGRCASEGADPRRGRGRKGGHQMVCQRGRWALKRVDFEIPRRLKRGTSASENAGPLSGWIVRSHIDWRGE